MGAGGKTTLIHRLSEELQVLGVTVLITTTTKMYRPAQHYFEWTGAESAKELKVYLDKERIVTVGCTWDEREDKITGVPEENYQILAELADVLLVEADGSKRKPVKVPAEYEPVIYPNTDLVIGVLGMRSVGLRIAQAAHRPEDVAAFLNVETEHIFTKEDLRAIAYSSRGLKKGVDCAFVAVGNQYE